MNYDKRLRKVIDYIGEHLDEELSLENLSDIFHISKFHFHRLFTVFTGLSLQQYIKWLRLKRAAHQLMVNRDLSILEIAIKAGFESHEAFSRAFKKACGISPSQYREGASWSHWEQSPYCLPKAYGVDMTVEIKNMNKIRLAVIEHRGDPKLVALSVKKLVSWIQSKNLKPKSGDAFGLGYDDPKITPASQFRMDLGIKVPDNLKLDGDIIEKYLPAGRYAVAMHKGSHDTLNDTVYYLYRDWLQNTSEELGDFPCVFCYHNFEHEVAETELLTECRILLK